MDKNVHRHKEAKQLNDLKIFDNPQFGSVRTLVENETILFCGSDVARALGYSNPRDALSRHCKGVVKRDTLTLKGEQEMSFIPESDLYRLIVHSKLPAAEKFERWVFDEVLPSIRAHGMYATPEKIAEMLLDPDAMIQTLQALKAEREERKRLEAKAEEDKPKVLFAEAVSASQTSILVGDLAKLLRQNGASIGQNRLFEMLRKDGYLMKYGDSRNLPTQRAMEMGLFEIKETTINNPDGSIRITKTTKVTGKGQIYFVKRYLKEA